MAHRLLYHSTLGSGVMKKKKKNPPVECRPIHHEVIQANRIKPLEKGWYGLEGRAVRSAGCTSLLPYTPF